MIYFRPIPECYQTDNPCQICEQRDAVTRLFLGPRYAIAVCTVCQQQLAVQCCQQETIVFDCVSGEWKKKSDR